MSQYRITLWENGRAYCYRVSTNAIDQHVADLKKRHDRVRVEEVV